MRRAWKALIIATAVLRGSVWGMPAGEHEAVTMGSRCCGDIAFGVHGTPTSSRSCPVAATSSRPPAHPPPTRQRGA
jgi:hypothetical protein